MASVAEAITAAQKQISNPFRRAYFTYGYLPFLLVLDQFEQQEYYLTCHLMKTALLEAFAGENMATRYSEEALEATKADFKQRGWSDQMGNYLHNVPNYAVECRKFIQTYYPTYKY